MKEMNPAYMATFVNIDPWTRELLVQLPVRIRSVANLREHWGACAKRSSDHKSAVTAVLNTTRWAPSVREADVIFDVTLVRYGAKSMDDDNLAGGFKAVRDAVAHYLDVDDGGPLIRFEYRQVTPSPYGIAIRIIEVP